MCVRPGSARDWKGGLKMGKTHYVPNWSDNENSMCGLDPYINNFAWSGSRGSVTCKTCLKIIAYEGDVHGGIRTICDVGPPIEIGYKVKDDINTPRNTDVVKVDWEDITFNDNWNAESEESFQPTEVTHVGYLLEDTPQHVAIASGYSWREETWATVHTFPKAPPIVTVLVTNAL